MNDQFALDSYDYVFPEELLAHNPSKERPDSRLLDYSNQIIRHRYFSEITQVFQSPCLFIRNNTRVRNGRLYGRKGTGGQVECLLTIKHSENRWDGLFKPAKRLKLGQVLHFAKGVEFEIVESKGDGVFEVEIHYEGDFEEYLLNYGEIPLPPYITDFEGSIDRYQTVYSKCLGASASPTAGLHFDAQLIANLESQGHQFADITLHVGPGTFRPVDTADIRQFKIHKEYIEVGAETTLAVLQAKERGYPIVCIGTTSLRALETAWRANQCQGPHAGWTNLYLLPGESIQSADYLVTNFHLPKSSLMILIASLIGVEKMKCLYNEALIEKYRLFSFGDSMLIPNMSRT